MIVVWSGLGFLVPLIAAVALVAAVLVAGAFGKASGPTFGVAYAVFGGLAALVIWRLGRRLKGVGSRALVDEKTGERIVLRRRDTFFFISMEYWAIVVAVLALVLAVLAFSG